MSSESVADSPRRNLPNLLNISIVNLNRLRSQPYPDQLIFGACGKVFAIRTEADAPNVKITIKVNALVLEDA